MLEAFRFQDVTHLARFSLMARDNDDAQQRLVFAQTDVVDSRQGDVSHQVQEMRF